MKLPQRTRLHHATPPWVEEGSAFFITICCAERGRNSLALPEVFKVVEAATQHYVQEARWWCHILLAMPDHLHAILSFSPEKPVDKTVRDWKRYIAKTARISWQDGFFEHRLRNNESIEEKTSYICMNPVRSNLCSSPDAWPHRWFPSDASSAR